MEKRRYTDDISWINLGEKPERHMIKPFGCPCKVQERGCPIMVAERLSAEILAKELKEHRAQQGDRFDAIHKRIDDWQKALFIALLPFGLSFLGLVIGLIVVLVVKT